MSLADGVVVLDRFTDADIDSMWAGEDDDYVRRTCQPGPFTRRDIATRIRHWQAQWLRGGPERSFAIREAGTGKLVGGCVLDIPADDREMAELSYWVFPPYRRRGYATRAAILACRYAFDDLGVVRTEVHIAPANDASLRVATNAGFRQAGLRRRRDGCRRPGGRRDMVRFSSRRTERQPPRPQA